MTTGNNERLLSLDVARGIAALCVVIFHWPHFYLAAGDLAAPPPEFYPFRSYLGWTYHYGWLGVDFFFVLSGAIFFIKYADAIAKRSVTAWQFFVLRFSRLYPLHFATLIVVAALQAAIFARLGHFADYQDNDVPHFITNLFFIQNWGLFLPLLSDISFNAPAWSLSIEALLYIAFFALFRFVPMNILLIVLIALTGLLMKAMHPESMIGRGLWCFFMGGGVGWCCRRPTLAKYFKPALYIGTAIGLCLIAFDTPRHAMIGELHLVLAGWDISPLFIYVLAYTVFAGVIGWLILWERVTHKFARPLAFLGDISYSTYLLHFPLQLTLILAVALLNGQYTTDPFRSPLMFAAYFCILIPLSLVSFHWFEVPAQRALRATMLAKRVTVPSLSDLLPEPPDAPAGRA